MHFKSNRLQRSDRPILRPELPCGRGPALERIWRAAASGVAALLISASLTGCKRSGAAAAGAPPPVQVIVVEARRQPVSETLSLPATIAPNESVEIRPESEGIIKKVNF